MSVMDRQTDGQTDHATTLSVSLVIMPPKWLYGTNIEFRLDFITF